MSGRAARFRVLASKARPLALASGAAACGALAAGAALLRVIERGEEVGDRALALVAAFGAAGALGALATMASCALFAAWRRGGAGSAALGAFSLAAAAPCFVAAFAFAFAVQHNAYDIANFIAHPDLHGARYVAYRMVGIAGGYVAVFGPAYFWPWTAPAIVVGIAGAGFLYARGLSSAR